MEALKLTAINHTIYIKQEPARSFGNRKIYRFILENSNSQKVVDSAATVITSLLKDNPQLCFVSRPSSNETLQNKIRDCRYLIINGDALCLSNSNKAPIEINIMCKDLFFSEAIIEEPVQCSKNRIFEKRYLEAWLEVKKNICPCSNHKIDSIEVDSYLLEMIKSIIETNKKQDQINRQTTAKIKQLEKNESIQTEKIKELEKEGSIQRAHTASLAALIKPSRTVELVGGSSKLTGKVLFTGKKLLVSKVADIGLESAVHIGLNVPFICLVFGVILAGYRGYDAYKTQNKAQYYKAVGELASGVASCFPGIGTLIGIGLDIGMACHDVYEMYNGNGDIKIAHQMLGLDYNQNVTKEEIDKAFRIVSKTTHPDLIKGEYNKEAFHDMQVGVEESKRMLYKYYGYND